MRKQFVLIGLILAVLLAFVACSSDEEVNPLEGTWVSASEATEDSVTVTTTVTMTLASDASMTMATEVVMGEIPLTVTIEGTYSYTDTTITFTITSYTDVNGTTYEGADLATYLEGESIDATTTLTYTIVTAASTTTLTVTDTDIEDNTTAFILQ